MLKIILIGAAVIAAIIVVILIAAALQPASFRVERSASIADFTFKPGGGKTLVTRAMHGENQFMGKLFSLFMNCEKMCGPEFEKGLADLEKIITSPAKP